ncbi:hypothetical protein CJ030_MR2G011742 [Morella rubra]|uniref:Uncharacterized protein n=1 Tax=Morella rubra TaxID=262757 RepID=A0A6A1WEG1_9ROSI|nr:hypothetical protein CJ030_MR2G011742 [Morella rubra]
MHRRVHYVTNSERRILEEIIDRGPSQAEYIPRFGTSALWSRQIREVFLNSWWMLHYMSICLAPSVKTFEKDLIGRLGVADLTLLSGRVIKVHLRRAWRYEIFSDPIGIRESRPSSGDESLQDQSLMAAGNGSMSSSGDVLLLDSVAASESSDALLLHRNARMTNSNSISLDPVERSPSADLEGVRSGLPTVPAWRSTSPWIEAIDLSMGVLAFVLEIVLLWITDSRPFELVVLVVAWINCLTAWTIFLWGARWRRAKFALPRFVLPNGQPYGHPIDYVEKYTSLALSLFTTVAMFFKFSKSNFSTTGLVLSATIFGAKVGIECQKRHFD